MVSPSYKPLNALRSLSAFVFLIESNASWAYTDELTEQFKALINTFKGVGSNKSTVSARYARLLTI